MTLFGTCSHCGVALPPPSACAHVCGIPYRAGAEVSKGASHLGSNSDRPQGVSVAPTIEQLRAAMTGWNNYGWKDGEYIDDVQEYFDKILNPSPVSETGQQE